MGLLGKAMATAVKSSTRSVATAATAKGRNGWCAFSMVITPS